MVFGIFAALAEFERELIRERTDGGTEGGTGARVGRAAVSSRCTKAQVRLAQAAMANRDTSVADLCRELGIGRGTLYRYVDPSGRLRDNGMRVLGSE